MEQRPPVTVPEPDEILAGLRQALTDVLNQDDLAKVDLDALTTQTPLLSLPIDSLTLMTLMTRIENAFLVYIPEAQAYAFASIGDVVDYIRDRAAAKAARQKV